jgi:acyl carrier protein phosphodiesterase
LNFLAHLLLAENTPESKLGNLLGDFTKGAVAKMPFNDAIKQGIIEHRAIDRFTDEHPLVHASGALLSPHLRRYKGIIVDVLYDHFLTIHWQRYSAVDLDDFIADCYRVLTDFTPILPPELIRILGLMTSENWLGRYKTIEGIDLTLQGLTRRFERRNNLHVPLFDATQDLRNHFETFEAHFLAFYPALEDFVVGLRGHEKARE